tara:strand:- start:147 stop:326 length:180 start_codon:yes stop_codon:yes gene_type:complete
MIEIRANTSFAGWLEVFFNGERIEEVQGRGKAMRIAKELARKHKVKHIVFNGKIIDLRE